MSVVDDPKTFGRTRLSFASEADIDEFVTTLEKLMVLDFDTVIPGHGRVLTKDDVRAYIPKLKTMNDRMRELARRKVPDDQLASQLRLDDIGWAHTVSTGTFMRNIVRYRDEVAAKP